MHSSSLPVSTSQSLSEDGDGDGDGDGDSIFNFFHILNAEKS